MATPQQRTRSMLDRCHAAGFDLAGIAQAQPAQREPFIRQWLAAGKQGRMDYLVRNLDIRLDPRKLLPGARSILCVADVYASARPPTSTPRPIGRVARYAWGRDYHTVMKQRLHALADELRIEHPAEQFRTTVDTAPLLEREHAARAGLGWIAKHTLLIHPARGSWLLLGAIVTTLELADSRSLDWPDELIPPADHCGSCTRCIDACPTQCITPYALDASRCISYLTLEHRELIPPDLHPAMGDWVAGCDVCQEVCPHNRPRKSSPRKLSLDTPNPTPQTRSDFNLLDVLNWTEDDRREQFRGSALKRIKLDMMKRNALIAAGNALRASTPPQNETCADLRRRIRRLADDDAESDLVRLTAKQVLASLPPGPSQAGG